MPGGLLDAFGIDPIANRQRKYQLADQAAQVAAARELARIQNEGNISLENTRGSNAQAMAKLQAELEMSQAAFKRLNERLLGKIKPDGTVALDPADVEALKAAANPGAIQEAQNNTAAIKLGSPEAIEAGARSYAANARKGELDAQQKEADIDETKGRAFKSRIVATPTNTVNSMFDSNNQLMRILSNFQNTTGASVSPDGNYTGEKVENTFTDSVEQQKQLEDLRRASEEAKLANQASMGNIMATPQLAAPGFAPVVAPTGVGEVKLIDQAKRSLLNRLPAAHPMIRKMLETQQTNQPIQAMPPGMFWPPYSAQ